MTKPLLDQLADKMLVGDGCWEWIGARSSNGYGNIRVNGRNRSPHRVVYELLVGAVPDGLDLDHLCRNRACANPAHLEAVSHRENIRRGDSPMAEQARRTRCPHGHEYTADNTTVAKGHRYCRTCNAVKLRRLRASRR